MEKRSNPDPIANCLHSVKHMIQNILRDLDTDQYRIFISGPDNFRKKVCPEYKANRKDTTPPKHLQAAKEYILDHWDGELTYGYEADDGMSLAQMEDWNRHDGYYITGQEDKFRQVCSTIICSYDKDLKTIPGWHYDWRTQTKFWVSEEEAEKFFWIQMLVGDGADNITGITGIGVKTAPKILDMVSPEEYECTVGMYYAVQFDDPEEVFERNKKLLRILREMPDDRQDN